MLEKQVERLRRSLLVDTIVVATPEAEVNKPIWDWCATQPDVHLYKGDEEDVLKRVLEAARITKTDVIVENTGDCPLVDPFILDLVTGYVICGHQVCVNILPPTWPKGMDIRVFTTDVLADSEPKTLNIKALCNFEWRNNVSTYLYRKDSEYDVRTIEAQEGEICPKLNLSVDDEADYKRVKDIFETLEPVNPSFGIRDILTYLATLPTYYDLINTPKLFKPATWMTAEPAK